MEPDEDVVSAVLAGERDDYARLVERYAGRTQALAYSYLKDVQAAEDVAQEAFIKAYTALRTLAAPKAFGAWLAQITRNLCRATLRRKPPTTTSLTDANAVACPASSETSTRAAGRQVREVLTEALDRLPPRLREVITLFYLKEQSIREIADFLGVSENAVKQRLHRARASLREHLEKALQEELAGVKPSGRFTGTVMALLPLQPMDIGWAAKGLAKLASWVMLTPWLTPIAVVLVSNKLTEWLFLADVNPRYHREFRNLLRRIGYGMLLMAAIICTVFILTGDHLWVFVVLLLVPSLLLFLSVLRSTSLILCTWRSRIWTAAFVVWVALFCAQLFYPYRDDLQLGSQVACFIFLAVFGYDQTRVWTSSRHEDTTRCEPEPVSMEFLRQHAFAFARLLNASWGPWVTAVEVEPDCVRYISRIPKIAYWLVAGLALWRPPRILSEIRLFTDGRVEVDLPESGVLPPHCPPREELGPRLEAGIRRKWALYVAGQIKQAKAVPLAAEMWRSDFFKSRKRWHWFRFGYTACLVILAVLIGQQFYMRAPTLTAARLQQFYEDEFLERYRSGFAEEPSQVPDHVAEREMLLYYHQPPSMMSVPGVAEAFVDLQRKDLDEFVTIPVVHQAAKLVHGLEGGYLTIPMIESWGFTREALTSNDDEQPEWASLRRKTLSGQARLDDAELTGLTARVRLLRALGMLDLMDSRVPDEVVKRLEYSAGAFCIPGQSFNELKTTCRAASILSLFDRWDLADRAAIHRWLVDYPRRHGYYCNADDLYHLALGVVAVGAEDDLPLAKLATFNRPTVGVNSRESAWSISPYDINTFAVNEILSTGRLLELQTAKPPPRGP